MNLPKEIPLTHLELKNTTLLVVAFEGKMYKAKIKGYKPGQVLVTLLEEVKNEV